MRRGREFVLSGPRRHPSTSRNAGSLAHRDDGFATRVGRPKDIIMQPVVPTAVVDDSLLLAMIHSSSVPLILLDGQLKVLAASDSFGRAFAIDPAAAEGSNLSGVGGGGLQVRFGDQYRGSTGQQLECGGGNDRRKTRCIGFQRASLTSKKPAVDVADAIVRAWFPIAISADALVTCISRSGSDLYSL